MAYLTLYTVFYCLRGYAHIIRCQLVAKHVGCSKKGFFLGPLCRHMLLTLIKFTASMLRAQACKWHIWIKHNAS